MKTTRLLPPSLVSMALLLLATPPADAQSVGRIRQSLDKATGGATQAPPRPAPAPAVPYRVATPAPAAPVPRSAAAQAAVDERVVAFLKQRIEDGSADAAFDLAKRMEEGNGVPADPVEARRLYSLAAERGNEEAAAWLAEHPEPESDGAIADPAEATEQAEEDAPAPVPKPVTVPAAAAVPAVAKP